MHTMLFKDVVFGTGQHAECHERGYRHNPTTAIPAQHWGCEFYWLRCSLWIHAVMLYPSFREKRGEHSLGRNVAMLFACKHLWYREHLIMSLSFWTSYNTIFLPSTCFFLNFFPKFSSRQGKIYFQWDMHCLQLNTFLSNCDAIIRH